MKTAILAEGLSKRFGDVEALSGLDLAVVRGEVLGYLGPNGAGKTTTIRLPLGMLRQQGSSRRLSASPRRVWDAGGGRPSRSTGTKVPVESAQGTTPGGYTLAT